MCHRYASCVGGSCECNDGYTGDGKNCIGLEINFISLNTSLVPNLSLPPETRSVN